MSQLHEVQKPIINSPFAAPTQHYLIKPGEPARLMPGRRRALYYYRPPERQVGREASDEAGTAIELKLVNLLRERVHAWREAGYPGVTRTTLELLRYWQREERKDGGQRLFFCQLESAETIIFLLEARADFKQGINPPRDEPGDDGKARGFTGFTRYACKMATGSGKTTVMAMLAAWSILNKVNDRGDGRFSDLALVVCPNVTIRDRLQELDPRHGERSLYRTRDLVPPHLMDKLRQGAVGVTNWHLLEAHEMNRAGDVAAKVVRRGVPEQVVRIRTIDGRKVEVDETIYVESDPALVRRVMKEAFGSDAAGRQNIIVFNDEAHHAYRLRAKPTEENGNGEADEDEAKRAKEATVWVSGLDKLHKVRGLNFCVDLSATPYYLTNTGNDPGRPFPWVVSDFGLIDAIESGLVKIPQLPIQDTTGNAIPAYFNVWKWIIEAQMTRAEKGGRKADISRKAVLKYAQTPIAQLAGLWRETFDEWGKDPETHPTPPVFIVVCRDTQLARLVHEWLSGGDAGTPPPIDEFKNRDGCEYTIRVDSKVVEELESGVKSDEARRLRFVLETIGKTQWPGGKLPEEWLTLVDKLNRKAEENGTHPIDPSIPPGRDVRCIVSVAMLTEGWDATTVTHIVGLRPFQSQLLCEQVVGRGLRRSRYDVLNCDNPDDIPEEEAKVYGVPFEIIPFKANPKGTPTPRPKIHHVHALPEREALKIVFPRVDRYTFVVRNRVVVEWDSIPRLPLDPLHIPPEVTMKGLSWSAAGHPTLHGPGAISEVDLEPWRRGKRQQQLEFDLARSLTRAFASTDRCEVPAQALFPQMLRIVKQFVAEKVEPKAGFERRDVFLNPYYGWAVETLAENMRPDSGNNDAPEIPLYESGERRSGSTEDVDLWTSRDVRDVTNSHINRVVADTKKWEQSAAFYLDNHKNVISFAKNASLGFAIPYLHSGDKHEYVPDYLARLKSNGEEVGILILEVKGYDPLKEVKQAAAARWVQAVNKEGSFGYWAYRIVTEPSQCEAAVREAAEELHLQSP